MVSEKFNKSIIIIAFTKKGISLALRLSEFFDAKIFVPERFHDLNKNLEIINSDLSEWTGKIFHETGAMIFIGACGIAVRAISKHIKSKLSDPAVIVIDENGNFVIPILSGHIGGANELAKKISDILHAHAVITTATDVNNFISPDEWAVKNNCAIENPDAIKKISSNILENENHSVGIAVTDLKQPTPFPVTLWLRPKDLILGAGCNKGISPEEFEKAAENFLDGAGVSIFSLKALASINIKSDEPALKIFAENHNIPFLTFSAEELQSVSGNFTRSEKVFNITGTDNVCERACVRAAGKNFALLRSKCIYGGITLALARTL